MISTTMFSYAIALFTLFAAVTAQQSTGTNYTLYQQFVDDIPSCHRDCQSLDSRVISEVCGDDFECACEQSIRIEDPSDDAAGAPRSQACIEACPESEDAAFTQAVGDLFLSCLPFIIENPTAYNTTSEFLCETGYATSCNNSSTNSSTNSTTSPGSPNVEFQAENGASSLLMSSFLIVAIPAALVVIF